MGGRSSRLPLCSVALLLLRGRPSAADAGCDALADLTARLNPAFWAPAYVFRSLKVRNGAIHAPNHTKGTGEVQLLGACGPPEAPLLHADSFVWERPTSDGGDWIATTTSVPVFLTIDGFRCVLTGVAVNAQSWPTLRLQFEACPRKTALEVPLVSDADASSAGRVALRLVRWMCQVAVESDLCRGLEPTGTPLLDLSPLADVASRGATRMQVYSECFENLDWFILNEPLRMDPDEFTMLRALTSLLVPMLKRSVRIQAQIVVENVCIPGCHGEVDPRCKERPSAAGGSGELEAAEVWDPSESFATFSESFSDPALLPWLEALLLAFFAMGSFSACCCLCYCSRTDKLKERRVKKVSLVYHEVPDESQFLIQR